LDREAPARRFPRLDSCSAGRASIARGLELDLDRRGVMMAIRLFKAGWYGAVCPVPNEPILSSVLGFCHDDTQTVFPKTAAAVGAAPQKGCAFR